MFFYRPSDSYYAEFTTRVFSTGVGTNADSLPTATANKNGTDDGTFTLTCANIDTGRYKITGTVPAGYASGDRVVITVAATVSSVADKCVVDEFLVQPASSAVGYPQTVDNNTILAQLLSALSPISGTVNDTGATTTTFITTLSSSVNDFYKGEAVVFTSGVLTGQLGQIFSYAGSTNTITLQSALTSAPANGVAFRLVNVAASRKFADFLATAMGTDKKVLLSSDAQTSVTIPTVTNLTNAPTNGDLTGTMKSSVTTAATAATPTVTAGTVSDKSGYSLSATGLDLVTTASTFGAAIIAGIWGATTRTLSAFGFTPSVTVSDKTGFSLSATGADLITSSSTFAVAMAAATWGATTRTLSSFGTLVADVATAVWGAGTRTLSAFGFTVATNVTQLNGSATAAANMALSAASMKLGTITDVAFSPTTSQFECSDITDAQASLYVGRIIVFLTGGLTRCACVITAYSKVGSNGHFTVAAGGGSLPISPSNGDTLIVI